MKLCIFAVAASLSLVTVSHGQLRIDFNDRSNDLPVHTQEGFDAFALSAIGGSTAFQTNTTWRYGNITVSVTPYGRNGLDDRRRTVLANTAAFTNAQLLQDMIFNDGATITDYGLSVRIQGLATNQRHTITVWSFDSNSTGNRVSDWFANGVLVKNNYTFNGSVLPTNNTACQFSFNINSDSAGEILIEGRRDSISAGNGVFLNGWKSLPFLMNDHLVARFSISNPVQIFTAGLEATLLRSKIRKSPRSKKQV